VTDVTLWLLTQSLMIAADVIRAAIAALSWNGSGSGADSIIIE
jgi:hypothetical protein